MHIDWSSLAAVAVVSAAATVTVVLLVSLAVVDLSTRRGLRGGRGGQLDVGPVAALCVLAAGVLVVYGVGLLLT